MARLDTLELTQGLVSINQKQVGSFTTPTWVIILRQIVYNMKTKSSIQMEHFFTRCLPIVFTLKTMFIHVSARENFSSRNCSKFAVECKWISKISQNAQKSGVFLEK